MLDYLKSRGCKIGGVTLGERGLVWYDETGQEGVLPALDVPERKGGGYQRRRRHLPRRLVSIPRWPGPNSPGASISSSRAASTYTIQHLGNEASLPTIEDIAQVQERYTSKAAS